MLRKLNLSNSLRDSDMCTVCSLRACVLPTVSGHAPDQLAHSALREPFPDVDQGKSHGTDSQRLLFGFRSSEHEEQSVELMIYYLGTAYTPGRTHGLDMALRSVQASMDMPPRISQTGYQTDHGHHRIWWPGFVWSHHKFQLLDQHCKHVIYISVIQVSQLKADKSSCKQSPWPMAVSSQ